MSHSTTTTHQTHLSPTSPHSSASTTPVSMLNDALASHNHNDNNHRHFDSNNNEEEEEEHSSEDEGTHTPRPTSPTPSWHTTSTSTTLAANPTPRTASIISTASTTSLISTTSVQTQVAPLQQHPRSLPYSSLQPQEVPQQQQQQQQYKGFPSEQAYLSALSLWAEEKKFAQPTTETNTLEGWYGRETLTEKLKGMEERPKFGIRDKFRSWRAR